MISRRQMRLLQLGLAFAVLGQVAVICLEIARHTAYMVVANVIAGAFCAAAFVLIELRIKGRL